MKGRIISEIQQKIFIVRGQKVMLDKDLAALYGVPTGRLNEQVKRNIKRFPEDFMFQLTREEADSLRSQFATLEKVASRKGKHSKYLSYAFTEQGVAMLSSVLRSERAIQVNITIMRIFVKIREILSAHKELAMKLDQLEGKVNSHDKDIKLIFDAIRKLMEPPPEKPKPRIGFI